MMAASNMYADTGWVDVTDTYIMNPRFDNNDVSGWWGTQFNISGNSGENGEHYERLFDSYQDLTGLTPGHYRLSVQAYFRSGTSDDDYQHSISGNPSEYQKVQLYATSSLDNAVVPVVLAASGATRQDLGGGSSQTAGGYIPNTQTAARNWFDAGYYWNSVEVTVGDDGQLTIGIRQDEHVGATDDPWGGWGGWVGNNGQYEWTCVDNWKLEYLGELVNATSITLDKQAIDINVDETFVLTATVGPDDATVKRVTWETSDATVAQVDQNGHVTGVGRGVATITATTTDGSDLKATCKVTVKYSGGTKESLVINEIMVANIDMFLDPSWNFGGWVELYNPTDQSANIGRYWVSDDPENLKKAMLPAKIGSVPAHGFFTLWFDHADTQKDVGEHWLNTQVNMELDADGGTIYISDDQGNLLVSQDYPSAFMRASYARKTDGGDEWGWTSDPTPTLTNKLSTFATEQLDNPVVDQPGQLFTTPLNVTVTIPKGATLMYTTDGTTPTLTDGILSRDGKFTVTETTTYRWRLFRSGYLPSGVVTRSYIYNDRDYYLPVVSVVTDPANLYDDEIGVYVSGSNGKTANQDWTKRNFNMEWDRPVNFEYIVDNQEVVNKEVYYAIAGGWSRKYLPKSFKLKANSVFGDGKYDYTFFKDKPYNRNKSLLLRNGGNDNYNKYRLKDISLQEIARLSGFKLNLQSVQPTHVFYNGEHIGMLNMREPSNKHWAYANLGTNNDEIDSFEMSVDSGYVQKSGTRDAFDYWYHLTEDLAADPQNSEIYKKICEIVDIDDYVNYFAYKFFLNDWDWPHNNCKGFRDRNDGKFRFMVFDLDNCVDRTGNNIFNDFENKRTYTFYQRPEYNGTSLTKEVELVTMFLNTLGNDTFRKKFIDTYCIVGGCVFRDDDELARIVNELADERRTALRWEGNDPVGNNKERSQGIINAITGQFKSRMMTAMKNYRRFNLTRAEIQAVELGTNIPSGRISINGIEVPKAMFNGYLFAPDTLRAYDIPGYRFMGWQEGEMSDMITTEVLKAADTWLYFEHGSLDDADWKGQNYNTTGWYTGQAPFGFGNNGRPMSNATTKLTRLDENNNSRPTFYFRKEFTLDAAPKDNETYTFNFELDDGIIVYINGQEIGTYHMPSGANYADYVQTYYNDTYEGENPYIGTMPIDRSVLKKGKNVIAVEVHNCNNTSSDLWFDASITMTKPREQQEQNDYISTDAEYILPSTGSHHLTACYEPLTKAELAAAGVTPVRVNEVSASNNYYVNEYNKRNDWIELYNTTDEDIDLAGMYLSDNVNKPQKYQITAQEDVNTIIPAHGFKIVWCDKLEPVSQMHATFKLAAECGAVVLTAANGEWADTLNYCEHTDKQTVGRYPDGGSGVYVLTIPSIESTNRIGSYDSLYYNQNSNFDSAVKNMLAQENSLTVRYENSYVSVTSEHPTTAQLTMFTSAGQQCRVANINLQSGNATLFVGDMPKGVYVVNVNATDGQTGSCKVVIK